MSRPHDLTGHLLVLAVSVFPHHSIATIPSLVAACIRFHTLMLAFKAKNGPGKVLITLTSTFKNLEHVALLDRTQRLPGYKKDMHRVLFLSFSPKF